MIEIPSATRFFHEVSELSGAGHVDDLTRLELLDLDSLGIVELCALFDEWHVPHDSVDRALKHAQTVGDLYRVVTDTAVQDGMTDSDSMTP